MNIKELDKKYIANTYSRFDVVIKSGKGSKAYDEDGREYIDFAAGIATNSFGYCDEVWKNAVKKQLDTLQHASNLYYTEPCVKLAKLLCEKTGAKKVFFSNSGAEANECAIKAARKYGTDKDKNKNVIITLKNSFHGRTVTTLSATGQEVFHESFTPFTEGFVYAEASNKADLDEKIKNNNVCAIMIEVVQGEGGVMPLDPEYLEYIEKVTTENDILLVIDEVQTGNGRCGKLYSYMNYSLTPDIVSTAKGLAGGLPFAATMLFDKCENVYTYSTHGSTFGGNPICASAALSVIERLDDAFLESVAKKGEYIKERLSNTDGVISVSGLGLMIGIECKKDAKQIISKCIEKGLLVISAKTKVRLVPPLNISFDDLKAGMDILCSVIEN